MILYIEVYGKCGKVILLRCLLSNSNCEDTDRYSNSDYITKDLFIVNNSEVIFPFCNT